MPEQFKYFRPWEDSTPSQSTSIAISTSSGSPQSSTTFHKRICVRCKCPNCVLRQLNGRNSSVQIVGHKCHYENCGKTYQKTSHLKAHIRCHTGERKHVCRDCFESFTRSDHLKQHAKVNHPPVIFVSHIEGDHQKSHTIYLS
ncbi:hypothetical protein WR25_16857 [Diploscapter pachys]|uniref:C2H2-type domain-containing protein n=1 Tax=Diploscapter pachys TaxID=2018661 RepID=A0A2A2LDW2_9BILA|nr:hypothetical protein WR25_16857 [Diploscapter pachys]